MILAIDPGRDKCGVVVMSESGEIKFQKVIETINFSTTILELEKKFDLQIVILGNGTTSKELKLTIEKIISTPIKVVDEKHTTEEARKLYWIKNPPQGWRKFLPVSMQVPPEPVDGIVAEILIGLGYLTGVADGDFGEATENALKDFQYEANLEVNGIFDDETFNIMNSPVTFEKGKIPEDTGIAEVGDIVKPGMHGAGVEYI